MFQGTLEMIGVGFFFKCWYPSSRPHGIMCQKTVLCMFKPFISAVKQIVAVMKQDLEEFILLRCHVITQRLNHNSA